MHTLPITVLTFLALSAPAYAFGWGVQGNGKPTTETHQVRGFSRIELRSSLDANIKEGPNASVQLTIDSNLQPLVTTEVKGDLLIIDTKENIHPTGHPRLEITVPDFRGVTIEGSGDATVTGSQQPKDVALSIQGSGEIRYAGAARTLNVTVDGSGDVRVELATATEQVRVELSGSGNIELKGAPADSLKASIAGSGDIKARQLTAKNAELSIAGSGDIEVTLGGGELRADLSGSGDVNWWGQASQKSIDRSGSGEAHHHS